MENNNSIYRERALLALATKRERTLILPPMLRRRSILIGWTGLVMVFMLMAGACILPVETSVSYQPETSEIVRSGDAQILRLSLPASIKNAFSNEVLVSIPALELFEVTGTLSSRGEILIEPDEQAGDLYKSTRPSDLNVTIRFKQTIWQQLATS